MPFRLPVPSPQVRFVRRLKLPVPPPQVRLGKSIKRAEQLLCEEQHKLLAGFSSKGMLATISASLSSKVRADPLTRLIYTFILLGSKYHLAVPC